MSKELFNQKNGIIPALDESDPKRIEFIVANTCNVKGIVGYKISGRLALRKGLEATVGAIRKYTDKPIILDYQKAGTDVPFIEKLLIESTYDLVDGIIFFPLTGPESQKALIEAAKERGVVPIAGGFMTHPKFVEEEGGYIPIRNIERMYLNSVKFGVTYFVVPANRVEIIEEFKKLLGEKLSRMGLQPKFLGPGIGRQGGDIRRAIEASKPHSFYGIVGRAIREAKDPTKAAMRLCGELCGG